MEKFECTVSHERTLHTPESGFRRFEAGRVYGGDEIPGGPDEAYFRPVPAANKKVKEV